MKLSALFVALTMAVGFMATPAAASDGVSGAVQDFFEWSVNAQRETGDAFWRAIYGDSWNPDGGFSDGVGADRTELTEKYSAYTETLQTEVGTTVLTDDGVRLYPEPAYIVSNTGSYGVATYDGFFVTLRCNFGSTAPSSFPTFNIRYKNYTAPFACDVVSGSISSGNDTIQINDSNMRVRPVSSTVSTNTLGKGTEFSLGTAQNGSTGSSALLYGSFDSSLNNYTVYGSGSKVTGEQVLVFAAYVDMIPTLGLSGVVSVDVTDYSRAGSIAGDVYVVNENGEETVYNDYSVVNETTNIYNDPISGTERPMEEWAYDYIERQYNITLEDGANVTIKYGDENIEIVEGDSIETLNYGSGSSGEGGGDDGGGGSGIGDAIANLFTVLGEIILGLITALINLATRALDALKGLFDLFGQFVETITGFFGGFTDFLAGVFPFLPEETFTIFNFGLILLVAATVFRKFLK